MCGKLSRENFRQWKKTTTLCEWRYGSGALRRAGFVVRAFRPHTLISCGRDGRTTMTSF